MHFQPNLLPDEPVGDHFLAAYGQHVSTIQPFVWSVLLASSRYPDANEGTCLRMIEFLGC